jgi:hypothetical protein
VLAKITEFNLLMLCLHSPIWCFAADRMQNFRLPITQIASVTTGKHSSLLINCEKSDEEAQREEEEGTLDNGFAFAHTPIFALYRLTFNGKGRNYKMDIITQTQQQQQQQ